MPKLNQRGIASLLILMLLLVGIGVGVYLVQNRTNIFPKAASILPSRCNPQEKDDQVISQVWKRVDEGTCNNGKHSVEYQCGKKTATIKESCPQTKTPTSSKLTLITSCAEPHSEIGFTHMEVYIEGSVTSSPKGGYWTKVTDTTTEQSVITGFSESNIFAGHTYHDQFISRNGNSLKLYADGRTYKLSIYNEPYSQTDPILKDLLVEKEFSQKCDN